MTLILFHNFVDFPLPIIDSALMLQGHMAHFINMKKTNVGDS